MQRKIGEVFTTSDGVTLKVESNSQYGCPGCKFLEYMRDGFYHCTLDFFTAKITGTCVGRVFVEVEQENK